MEMEKSYYVVSFKPAYGEMVKAGRAEDEPAPERLVVAITQGGFGQDIVDDERQTKERFLEHLFYASGVDLERTPEVFDQYFTLDRVDEFVDLDEET
ncbi:MAG TPA: hypothetical protein VJH03_09300 [Blastocatellia bacterium]|nr:hypothetical protein [Blastocatellia bacterium]